MDIDHLTLAAMVGVIAFLWTLHRDIRALTERVARLEGQMQVLSGNVQMVMQVLVGRENAQARDNQG